MESLILLCTIVNNYRSHIVTVNDDTLAGIGSIKAIRQLPHGENGPLLEQEVYGFYIQLAQEGDDKLARSSNVI